MKITLLGTAAGPVIWRGRMGISTLIDIGGRGYLVDLGIGSVHRYREFGGTWEGLRNIFLTHAHSDHTLELPHAILVPWDLPGESYSDFVTIWGPESYDRPPQNPDSGRVNVVNQREPLPGIRSMLDALIHDVYQGDVNIRMIDEGRRDPRSGVVAKEIRVPANVNARATGPVAPAMDPLVVMEDDRVRVTAILVDHRYCFPSFAYRFDSDEASIVISGDTTVCRNLGELARGADLLVHEAIHLDRLIEAIPAGQGRLDELVEHWRESHTLHTEVGEVASDAGVRELVLSHLAPGHVDAVSDEEWIAPARNRFGSRAYAGRDLNVIGLGRPRTTSGPAREGRSGTWRHAVGGS